MTFHPLIKELHKLKESSRYAIANGIDADIDDFKKYLHVEREVELNLKTIIEKSYEISAPQLILVCGNVGDGKSHVLSYLHSSILDKISEFQIHNDATESHNPNETSNQTLYRLLDGFKDVNIDSCSDKIILAINLGTLSKFIEEYRDEFTKFESYILSNNILETGAIKDIVFNSSSIFHHINFTDYHLFSLTNDGPVSEIISEILQRIVKSDERNPIYSAYLNYKKSILDNQFCPVLYNYEFLFEEKNRTVLTQLIIKAIIKSKEIVSIRTLLNFIYEVIVPINFSEEKKANKNFLFDKNRIDPKLLSMLLPNYIFEHPELSSLYSKVMTLDPCIDRKEELDTHLLNYVGYKNIEKLFSNVIDESYVKEIDFILKKSQLNQNICKFFIRLNYFSQYSGEHYLRDSVYDDYVIWLYHFNNENMDYVKKIYDLFNYTAKNWNGDSKAANKVVISLDNKQDQYRVFKDFKTQPSFKKSGKTQEVTMNRFSQEFILRFNVNNEIVTINIDYGLYTILRRVDQGYRPNKKDCNNYIYFVEAINKLVNNDIEEASIYIDEINTGQAIDYTFSRDYFGNYKFTKGK